MHEVRQRGGSVLRPPSAAVRPWHSSARCRDGMPFPLWRFLASLKQTLPDLTLILLSAMVVCLSPPRATTALLPAVPTSCLFLPPASPNDPKILKQVAYLTKDVYRRLGRERGKTPLPSPTQPPRRHHPAATRRPRGGGGGGVGEGGR